MTARADSGSRGQACTGSIETVLYLAIQIGKGDDRYERAHHCECNKRVVSPGPLGCRGSTYSFAKGTLSEEQQPG